MLRYEHKTQPPVSRRAFIRRLLQHGGYALLIVGVSMVIGTAGYIRFAHQPFIDAFLNSAMLLGGMGPVGPIDGNAGKVFAALFALYAGLVFLIVTGLLLAPVFHRVLHHFHWEQGRSGK